MIDWATFETSPQPDLVPNLYLAGFQKCASTTLALTMAQHSDIFLPGLKEPHFFDEAPGSETDFNQLLLQMSDKHGDTALRGVSRFRSAADYTGLYRAAGGARWRMDASPSYIVSPNAIEMIARVQPQARIIATLRNPYERTWSAYTYFRSYGREPETTFADAIAAERNGARDQWIHGQRYLYVSQYGRHIARLLDLFPRSQILLLRTDRLRRAPEEEMARIADFLDIAPFVGHEMVQGNKTVEHSNPVIRALVNTAFSPKARRLLPKRTPAAVLSRLAHLRQTVKLFAERFGNAPARLSSEDRALLAPVLETDLDRLEQVTGEDFSTWRMS